MSKLIPYALRDEEEKPSRQRILSHIIDDGWTDGEEKEPWEILEAIDLIVQKTYRENRQAVIRAHNAHKGEWLTRETVEKYRAKSWAYRVIYNSQYINEVREIGRELQELYGVSELEAINILNGRNIDFYVNKYYMMQHCIPAGVSLEGLEELLAKYA